MGSSHTEKSRRKIIVTGSARLDYYRKGGDSLAGRYRYFRLHPFSLRELNRRPARSDVAALLKFGGFPEPLFTQNEAEHRIWQRDRISRVVREDLRDLEHVREISLIEHLTDLLPSKVGSPLSVKSLREDLQIDHMTAERWLQILESLYVCFRILPYGAPRIRAVTKERKLYLWDWSSVEGAGPRFENMVAFQLLKYCHWMEDTQGHAMELRYLRDTDKREVEAVHAEGAKLFGQVIHLGRQIEGDFERTASFGPSPVRWSPTGAMPHAMHADDMAAVIDAHVVTAKNLIEAGMDGFEVQVGHGHLLQQFLSPLSNLRCDAYGGSEDNRLRFPLAVLQAVRAAVGAAVTVGIRISGSEFIDGGLTLADSLSLVPKMLDAVRLDFVNVSHSAYHMSYSLATQFADMHFDPAPFRELSREIRRVVRERGHDVPILAVGKYRTVAEAEAALAAGVADMVGLARGHIADAALVAKSFAGREDEIAQCIGCNQGCAAMLEKNLAITCLVNPATGRERSGPRLRRRPLLQSIWSSSAPGRRALKRRQPPPSVVIR